MTAFLLFLFFAAQASAADCFDQKLAARVTEGIRLNLEEPAQNPLCDSDSRTYKLVETLAALKSIRFNPKELPRPYNQSILPMGLWKYFAEPTMRIMDAGEHSPNCAEETLAFVLQGLEDGTVYLCPYFYNESQTMIDRVSVLLHEVRHFSGHPHVDCTRGFDKGAEASCDEALGDKGSYAVSVESLTKMALLEERFTPMQKAYAKMSAISFAENRINRPSAAVEAVYLRSVEGKAYFFDGTVLVAAPFVPGHVISRVDKLAVFPADHSDAFSLNLLSPRLLKDPPDGNASTRFNSTEKESRPEIVDLVWTPKITCSALAHELNCNVPEVKEDLIVKIAPEIKSVFLGSELGMEEGREIYVSTESGQVTKVELSAKGDSRLSSFTSSLAVKFSAISVLDGHRFGLTRRGEILMQVKEKWIPVPALAGRKFGAMSRAVEWNGFFYGK